MSFEDLQALLEPNPERAVWVVAALVFLSFLIARYFLARGIVYLTTRTKNQWDEILVKYMRPFRLSWVAPLFVVFYFADMWGENAPLVVNATLFIILWLIVLTFISILSAVNLIYESRATYTGLSIQGYLDIVKLIFLSIGIILSMSLFTGQSPVLVLGGLGAASAILLLIFQDSILDLVASVQIAINDLVKEGDWIEVPDYDADGEVANMSLNTIKIRNWDNTFTVIPTHKLNETSYKNWRGMSQSGSRRIKRSLNLDIQSIHFCTPKEIEHLKTINVLKDFVEQRGWESRGREPNRQTLVEPRLTNVGAFISYVDAYLRLRDDISKDMTILVYHLDSGPQGLPVEIYCYTTVIEWEPYEIVQAAIFDHVLASLPEFGLRVLQYPSEHHTAGI